eukprot:6090081-Pleurochrysis_carterae.AAC.2
MAEVSCPVSCLRACASIAFGVQSSAGTCGCRRKGAERLKCAIHERVICHTRDSLPSCGR